MRNILRGHRAGALAVALAAMALLGNAARPAQAQGRARNVVLPAGTVLPVALDDRLSSADAQRGDTFTATIRTNSGAYYGELPEGTTVEGVVQNARPHSGNTPGVLDLSFRRIVLPDGRSYAINGSLISLNSSAVTRGAGGRIYAKPNHKNDKMAYVGYGAGAGLLLSILTNHGHNLLQDILIGGGLGYLYGQMGHKGSRNPSDVVLNPGTEMGVRLDRRAVVAVNTVGSSGSYVGSAPQTPAGAYYGGASRMENAAADVQVLIDNQPVQFPGRAQPRYSSNGMLLVPAAPVLRAANVPYTYDSRSRSLIAGDARIVIGSRVAVQNGRREVLPAPAQIANGSVVVPYRFLVMATGYNASWDAPTHTLILTSPEYQAPSETPGTSDSGAMG